MKYKKYDKFLSKATNNYRYSDCIKKDVRYVLNSYPGLSPELDNFVFNDGSEKKLLNLKGTIPVKYKGASYNIPVCFWLPEDYPHNPPMAFVKPTPDMEIKVSEKVDSDGKISLRILTTWKEDPEASVNALITACITAFGRNPPVFSKPPLNQKLTSKSQIRSVVEVRLKAKLNEEFMKTRAEIDSLHETTKDLLDSQEALSKHLTELQELSKVSDSQQETLTTLRTKFRNSIDSLTSLLHSGINPDEIIHPQYPLQQQILCAYVEDASADDSIFFLGEALRRGRIDLEVYLKRVRQISRKQFMSRVIIERCRRQMGLLEISKS
ncbi:tumor susceptibility gene 101 protein [Lepeophtheirus salmonis]|uniref:Tumor susceptibility gene 101 proteinlike [Oryzias latipes] n=1 Tax=Lepeophtheirus salmonis TaxID=72036 RepID=A0A0K2SWN4_LEPSM|nr:tumor susceptibility gene 101 protein-like [Lepeophtheirus salmonis]